MGYHSKPIKKGELGSTSKIQEELDELIDAEDQGAKILVLCELSDLVGAIEAYLEQHFRDSVTLGDLKLMSDLTKSAFKDGER